MGTDELLRSSAARVSKVLDTSKYQNLDKAKLLEKIDDDIQELNLLKRKIRQLEHIDEKAESEVSSESPTTENGGAEAHTAETSERAGEEKKEIAHWKDRTKSTIDHALQTAEAIRKDNKPRWFQLVGLIHDLGKLLYFFDSQGQWDVVGDTFPVGCKFSKKIIYYDYFKENVDAKNPLYRTKYGLYSPHCGLDNVMLSWGHDEYMYHLAKEQATLPPEGLAMIRYHSFYPWHSEGAYKYLMNEKDKEMLECVQAFNPYDLYSKTDVRYDIEELKPYYLELIDEFFPNKIVQF
ncbi:hypothetical protein PMKS-001877 [Pichia membranifaciens]|uniref:Inositol oxygenase n=1 Tax=Pichia membranifaciens TaxID=4926 RepID=A0A1Q2YFQ0_9ASCO|nr:hypothetical protein PMKS-001877 [Pichia membranifaciens]